MTKENIEKIFIPNGILGKDDLSIEEKVSLRDFLSPKGISEWTLRRRLYITGFSEWEILGIANIKKRYLELPEVAEALLAYKEEDEQEGDKGYLYTLAKSDEHGVFYDCISKVKMCVHFQQFMKDLGMVSNTTVLDRFSQENWKPFELYGIKAMINKWLDESCYQEI